MTDDLETRLHDAYVALDPGAPSAALRERARLPRAGEGARPWRLPVRFVQLAAVLAIALLVAGGGLLLAGAVQPVPSLSLPATPTASPRSTPGRPSTAPPSSSDLPPGARVVDGAWAIAGLDWSPDGGHLAVLRADQDVAQGLVDILDPGGHLLAGYDASTAGWVDATHIATYQASEDGSGGGTATVHAIDGTTAVPIAGAWAGILPDGHGSLLLTEVPTGQVLPDRFRIWTAGILGPEITGHGDPMQWSPDGRLLALESDTTYGGGTGGPISADLQVLQFPGALPVSVPGDRRIDGRSPLVFSPDSRSLVATPARDATPDFYSPTLYDLSGGATTRAIPAPGTGVSWTPDGRLIVQADDGSVRLWSPANGSVTAGPAGPLAYGPEVGDLVTTDALVNGSPTTITVTDPAGSVTLAATGEGPLATWTPDGNALFVATGSSFFTNSQEPLIWLPAPGLPVGSPTPNPDPTSASASLPPGAELVAEAPTFQTLDVAPDRTVFLTVPGNIRGLSDTLLVRIAAP